MPGYSSPENVSRPTSDLGRLIRRQRHHNLALYFIAPDWLLGPRASRRVFESSVEVGHDPGRTLDPQECVDMDSGEGRQA